MSDIIICCTSFGDRINHRFLLMLDSLDCQTVKPREIRIYLTEQDIKRHKNILNHIKEKYPSIKILASKDYRSFKKFQPLIDDGYSGWFVTCDDDIFYHNQWFANLVSNYKILYAKKLIPCVRAHLLGDSYSTSQFNIGVNECKNASSEILATSGSGLLFHTKLLTAELCWDDLDEFIKTNDDIYLYYRAQLCGFNYYRIPWDEEFATIELFDPRSEYLNLNKTNVSGKYSDLALCYFRNKLSKNSIA